MQNALWLRCARLDYSANVRRHVPNGKWNKFPMRVGSERVHRRRVYAKHFHMFYWFFHAHDEPIACTTHTPDFDFAHWILNRMHNMIRKRELPAEIYLRPFIVVNALDCDTHCNRFTHHIYVRRRWGEWRGYTDAMHLDSNRMQLMAKIECTHTAPRHVCETWNMCEYVQWPHCLAPLKFSISTIVAVISMRFHLRPTPTPIWFMYFGFTNQKRRREGERVWQRERQWERRYGYDECVHILGSVYACVVRTKRKSLILQFKAHEKFLIDSVKNHEHEFVYILSCALCTHFFVFVDDVDDGWREDREKMCSFHSFHLIFSFALCHRALIHSTCRRLFPGHTAPKVTFFRFIFSLFICILLGSWNEHKRVQRQRCRVCAMKRMSVCLLHLLEHTHTHTANNLQRAPCPLTYPKA